MIKANLETIGFTIFEYKAFIILCLIEILVFHYFKFLK